MRVLISNPIFITHVLFSCCSAQSFASPMQEVLQLAKERGIEGRVHIVTCGGEPKHKTDLENSLKDCMTAGYWLIVQNAHLIHAWTDNVLHLIKVCKV